MKNITIRNLGPVKEATIDVGRVNITQVPDLRIATVGATLAVARYTSTGYYAGGRVAANRATARVAPTVTVNVDGYL